MFFQQKYSQNSKGAPITLEVAIRQTAEVVNSFLTQVRYLATLNECSTLTQTIKAAQLHVDEATVQFRPSCVELKDLYLIEFRRTGATIQPILAYKTFPLTAASTGLMLGAANVPFPRDMMGNPSSMPAQVSYSNQVHRMDRF